MTATSATTVQSLVLPIAQTTARPIPLDAVRLEHGFWRDRAKLNRASLATALEGLEDYGALAYLRAAAARAPLPPVPALNDVLVYKIFDSDVYKWLEAFAVEQAREPLGTELQDAAERLVDLVGQAQWSNGYIDFSVTVRGEEPLANWQDGCEMYNHAHLIQAAVGWARFLGDRRLLDVAVRLADHLLAKAEEDSQFLVFCHAVLEMAFVELYRETRDARYLRSAGEQIDLRGRRLFGPWVFTPEHHQDDVPVRERSSIHGHAVMAQYLLCGLVDYAVEAGDAELLRVAVAQWEDMVARKLYITGGAGSRHHDEAFGEPFELAPDTAYAETCAAVVTVMLSWRLLLATGESRYADLIERVLYNGVLPGVSLDGCRFTYANPLHVRVASRVLSPDGYGHRQPWFECACCPPNLIRCIAAVGELVATTGDDALTIQQLIASTVQWAPDRRVRVDTDLPFGSGAVSVAIEESDDRPWTLRVRRPSWAQQVSMSASWSSSPSVAEEDGYFSVHRVWSAGDRFEIGMPMNVDVYEARDEVDAVRGQVALTRGPLVYCVEDTDLPQGTVVDSLQISPDEPIDVIDTPGLAMPGLRVRGAVQQASDQGLYHRRGAPQERRAVLVDVTAIPYFAWGNRGEPTMRVWIPERS